jgi:hypothetical protein
MQTNTQYSAGTCRNYGGYYSLNGNSSTTGTTTTTSTTTTSPPSPTTRYVTGNAWSTSYVPGIAWPTMTTMAANPDGGTCYYSSYACNGTYYNGQCYTGMANFTSCSSCNNIEGYQPNPSSSDCYYYNNSCKYISIDGECQTNRLVSHMFSLSHADRCRVIYALPRP